MRCKIKIVVILHENSFKTEIASGQMTCHRVTQRVNDRYFTTLSVVLRLKTDSQDSQTYIAQPVIIIIKNRQRLVFGRCPHPEVITQG